ncbi:hypothetical protein F5X96DRAFT_642087 [Biscogniauxia mediterranea]|nr:hypothetical protein F5X96DRAFT_642087 [Biscogniauxia mediterranea]
MSILLLFDVYKAITSMAMIMILLASENFKHIQRLLTFYTFLKPAMASVLLIFSGFSR